MPDKKYFINVEGQDGLLVDEDQFNSKKDELYSNYPDAQVSEVSQYKHGETEFKPGDYLAIAVEGQDPMMIDNETFSKKADELYKNYPDASVSLMRPVGKWGDSIRQEYSRQAAMNKLSGTDNPALEHGEEWAKVDAIKADLDAARLELQNYDRKNNGADGQTRAELRRKVKDLEKKYYGNNLVLGENESMKQSAELARDRLEELYDSTVRKEREEGKRPAIGYGGGANNYFGYDTETKQYLAAMDLYNDTIKIYDAPSKYAKEKGQGGFFKGAADRASEEDFWTMGLTGIVDQMQLGGVLDKIRNEIGGMGEITEEKLEKTLTPMEQELLSAFVRNADAQAARAYDTTVGYNAGKSAADSAMFMAEFLMSGAVVGGATKALTKGSADTLSKWIAKKIGKAGAKALGKGTVAKAVTGAAGRVLGDIGQSAALMLFQPGTVKSVIEAQNQLDESGELVDKKQAAWEGLFDRAIEVVSEQTGDYLGKVLGAVGGNKIAGALAKTEFGRIGKAFFDTSAVQTLRAGQWHGLFGEMSEEFIGAALRTATKLDENAWKDQWEGESLATMALSFLPMTILGGGVSTAQYGFAKNQYAKSSAQVAEILNSKDFGLTPEQIAHATDISRMSSPESVVETIKPVLEEMKKRGATQQDLDAIVNNAFNAARLNVYNGYESEKVEQERARAKSDLEAEYGDFWQGNEEEGETVQRITLPDGRTGYVKDKDETGEMLIQLDGGGIAYSTDGDVTTEGMDQYLDGIILARRQAEEIQVAQQEAQAAREQFNENLKSNTPVPMGTAEAEATGGVVLDENGNPVRTADGGYIVRTGSEEETPLTENDLAKKWGIELTPNTQEQKNEDETALYESGKTREAAYNQIPSGTEIEADLEELGPTKYKFTHAVYDEKDGTVHIFVEDATGKEVDLPESAFPDLSAAAKEISLGNERRDEEEEMDAKEMAGDNTPTVLRDSTGEPLPMRTTEDGTQKVDEQALWNNKPEEWVLYNDSKAVKVVDSKAKVAAAVATIEARNAEAASLLQQETLGEMNPAKIDQYEKEIARNETQLSRYRKILEGIDSREKQAESEAKLAQEQALEEKKRLEQEQKAQAAEVRRARMMEQRMQPLRERFHAWEERTGVKLNILENREEVTDEKAAQAIDAGNRIPGWFDPSTNEVYIYLPHVKNLEDADETVMHELTSHRGLRGLLGEEGYKVLCDRVWEEVMSPYDQARYMIYNRHLKGDEDYLRRAAADEFIANEIAQSAKTNPSLWDKFISLLKKILGEFNLETKLTKEKLGYLIQESLANFESLGDRSGKNMELAQEVESGKGKNLTPEEQLAARGLFADMENHDVRFSVRYAPSEEDAKEIAKNIAQVTGVSEEKALAWVKSETSLASIILDEQFQPYLDYIADERYQAIKKNSDYPQGTADFNNICRKRVAFTDMYQRLQKAYPNVIITGEDLATIRNIMKAHGIEVACGLCYVEDRRQLLGEIAKGFIDEVNNNFENYAKGGKTKAKNAEKFRELLGNDTKEDLSIYDLITLDGSTQLYQEHPNIYAAFQAYNNARGQQAGNLFQGYAEYKREILKWNKRKVKSVNDNGGLRIFSYSDFEAHHLIDLVQIIQDAARKGVMIQGYTKVPAFARAVANTGVKLNRSLIPLGDTGIVDGRLAYDPVEGIDINDPNFLESNDNIGNILIGINDEQIRLAMADPFVHYIIPYHTNQKKILRQMKQTGAWTNYKAYQNDRVMKTGKNAKENINIYTDVLAAAEAEGKPITNEREFTEKFLEVCKEKGLIPRFDQFLDKVGGEYVYTPGYAKLLLDFKLFDENGNFLPQRPVVAEFDDAFNKQILEDYVRGEKEKYDGDLDEVYDEIVSALGLEKRSKTGQQILNDILASIDRKEQEKKGNIMLRKAPMQELAETGMSYDNPQLLEKYNLEHVDLSLKDDVITLHRLIAKDKGQGNGTRFMNDLTEMADKNGLTVTLTPSKDFGASSVARLKDFYKRFGFKENKGRTQDLSINESMIRRPKETASQLRFRISNADQRIFISNAENALGKIKMEKATPEQWKKMLEKEGGLKAAEDKWLGLSQWLDAQTKKTLTKDEVADFIAENQIQIEETHYSDEGIAEEEAALKSYQDEIDEIIAGNGGDIEAAWNEMVDRYGDDFDMAFTYNVNPGNNIVLEPLTYWNGEPSVAARYFIDQRAGGTEKAINTTRRGYTTEGLQNLHEIALTVPTIEPWNEGDQIHFGDAGEGRAISWARFGDTWTSKAKDEAEKAYREADKAFRDYRNEIIAKYALKATDTVKTKDLANTEENAKVKELQMEASRLYHEWMYTNHAREKVLVIDEIQSKRHQEAREQGGYKDDAALTAAQARSEAAKKAYDDYMTSLIEKFGDFNEMHDKITPEENAESQRLYRELGDAEKAVARNGFEPMEDETYRKLREEQYAFEHSGEFKQLMDDWMKAEGDEARQVINEKLKPFQQRNRELIQQMEDREKELADEFNATHKSKIPAAPFEKNWPELTMKRMLRYAAEFGYDTVAWTTGEQQAERYNIGNVVKDIEKRDGKVYIDLDDDSAITLKVDKEGKILESTGAHIQSGEYNGKNLSDLVGKEVAVRVMQSEDGVLRGDDLRIGGEGMKGFYDDILVRWMNKYAKQWGVKVEDMYLPYVGEDALGGASKGLTMHSVKVTPEMKESVMSGQLMFRVAQEEKREDSQELFEAAKERFGTTRDLREAGYVLPDGSMLDFSGRHQASGDTSYLNGGRTVDHRDIEDLNFERDLNTPSGRNTNMSDFISRGAIRIHMPGMINLAMKPTPQQESVLERLINADNHFVRVEFGDGYNSETYADYDDAKPARVLNEIKRYFDEGVLPAGNVRFRVTPEQDKEYMDAVEAGDMEKAQQMVRDAAALAMPNTKVVDKDGKPMVVYHGTPDMVFTVFAQPGEGFQGLIWMTDQKRYAEVYAEGYNGEGYPNEGAGVYSLFANIENPLDMGYIEDVVGSDSWNNLAEKLGMTPEELFNRLKRIDNFTYEDAQKRMMYIYDYTRDAEFANLLKEKGFDGAFALEEGINKTPTYAAVDPSQVKSAEPVEYDDDGNVIPLSERFNPGNDDIRFRVIDAKKAIKEEGTDGLAKEIADDKTSCTVSVKGLKKETISDLFEKVVEYSNGTHPELAARANTIENIVPEDISKEPATKEEIKGMQGKEFVASDGLQAKFTGESAGKLNLKYLVDSGIAKNFEKLFSVAKFAYAQSDYDGQVLREDGTPHRANSNAIEYLNYIAKFDNKDEIGYCRFTVVRNADTGLTSHGVNIVDVGAIEKPLQTDRATLDAIQELVANKEVSDAKILNFFLFARTGQTINNTPEYEIPVLESPDATDGEGGSLFRIAPEEEESAIRFRTVTDPLKVAELEAKPKVKVYRSMQEIDGKLYPPMSAKVDGKLRQPTELGVWEEPEERPELADEKGEFQLNKGNGKSLPALYAPYFHTRRSPLNEQFSEAYNRPNLVIVEGEIPESELTSGYTAEKSKKSVGEHDWPSGKVSNALAKKGQDTRKVILSRWFKPVRIVPNSEVADMIMERLGDSDISFPNNVVTPGLREELKKRGAKFSGWQGNRPENVDEIIEGMNAEDTSGDIRFSIRGVTGASNDEMASVDLIVAEEMEKAGKDPKIIWEATGWERGVDGKWRNEIPDAEQKDGIDLKKSNRAGDILDAPDLFKSYPELEDIKIELKKLKYAGVYLPKENRIDVDTDYNTGLKDGKRIFSDEGMKTVVHELQHAIQYIEGFAKGGSEKRLEAEYYRDVAKTDLPLATFAYDISRKNSIVRLLRYGRAKLAKQISTMDKSTFNDVDRKALEDLGKHLENISEQEYVSLATKAAKVVSDAKKEGKKYERLAGEVEARNVEKRSVRRDLRENYPPSMTEDVDREKQIIRFRIADEVSDLLDRYEDGDITPWMSEGEFLYELEKLNPGDEIQSLISKYHRLEEENFEEGKRDFSGGEMEDIFDEIIERLHEGYNIQFRRADDLVKRVQEYGLRGVMDKESVDDFYATALQMIPEDTRREIIDQALGDDLNIRRQEKKYISELAYKGYAEDETGLLRALADKIKAETGEDLNENELLYMLWRGTDRYSKNDILSLAKDIALRRRLRIGDYSGEKFPNEVNASMDEANERIDKAEDKRDESREVLRRNIRNTPLKALNQAMTAQRRYDQDTIDSIVALAKDMIKKGNIDSVTAREMARLLTIIKDATGRRPSTVKASAVQLLDFMVDHTIDKEKDLLEKVLKIRTAKVKEPGVDTIAKLDLHAQTVVNTFRDNYKLSEAEISKKISDLEDKLDDRRYSDTHKEEMRSEMEGLALALEYATEIAANEAENKAIRDQLRDARDEYENLPADEKRSFRESLKELEESSAEMIRKNKIDRVEAYKNLRAAISQSISEGAERAKTFLEAERQRINDIHHASNADLEGVDDNPIESKPVGLSKLANSAVARLLFAPLANFDQLMRMLGRRHPEGRGYLWNRFMGQLRDANDNEKLGLDAADKKLNDKVREIFNDPTMDWNDLYSLERGMKKVPVKFFNANGKWVEEELTQGNMLYIYMVNKMADGRMKLRRMNISDEDVEALKKKIDPRFVELADWIQEEFLPDMRDKYNEVHKRLFGTSMASIDNYFPLRILGGVIQEDIDLSNPESDVLPAAMTGAIIKRKVNNKQLDITGTDALSLVIEHIREMEHWAAFAEVNRDLGTLLSYKRFQNQVKHLKTIYGTGRDLWNTVKKTSFLAAGEYRPVHTALDKAVVNLAKGVTAAKISFRAYTALKQILSYPAFLADTNPVELAKATLPINWKKNWDWAMENLPNFKKRVESRKAGNEILEDTDLDSKFWGTDFAKWINQNGMFMNAFVDALTVANGSKAVYETKKKQYLGEGFSEEDADKKAKMDATTVYNETQQSSGNEFLSLMQSDRTVASVALSVYRNSSMGYQRQLHQGLRTLGRMAQKGYKEKSLEFTTKQLVRQGLSEDEAKKAAEERYNKAGYQAAIRVAVFGFLVQFAWNLGSHAAYLLFGDDPDEKKDMLLEDATHALIGGAVEGLAAGNLISEAANMIKNGQSLSNWDPSTLPIMSDIKTTMSHLHTDPVAGANELVYLAAQIGLGTNPQTLSDAIVAIVDACNGDFQTAKEAMMCIMRILAVPQSQLDQFMIDEIGMTARDARELSYEDVAKRYVDYKMMRNAPLTGFAYSDELRKKREKSHQTTFKKKVNERTKLKEE